MNLSEVGGGNVPVGAIVEFPNSMPIDFTANGARYLRTGFIETNPANFDNTLFGQSRATYWLNSTANGGTNQFSQMMATNGSGVWVAVFSSDGTTTGGLRRSDDNGVTWGAYTSPSPMGANSSLFDVVWASSLSLFIAVGSGGLIFTSPDGTTWTQRTSGTTQSLNAVAWNGSLLVAVGGNGTVLTSTNGTTWTARTSNTTENLTSVAFGGGVWFAPGRTANNSTRSVDGTTWASVVIAGAGTAFGNVIHDGTQFVMVNGSGADAGVWTSSNANSWNKVANTAAVGFQSSFPATIGFANGQYVATSATVTGLIVSADLTKWKFVAKATGQNPNKIRFVSDRWVMSLSNFTGFEEGNGYLYAGWHTQYSVTGAGGAIGYVRIK